MTPRELQKALQEDLKMLLSKRRYKVPYSETRISPNVYRQFIPKRKNEDDPDPFPYIEVRIAGGKIPTGESPMNVQVFLIVGIYDDDTENQGMEAVMEIIETIQNRFEENPLLAGQFVCDVKNNPIEWDLQEEESWPYFFGVMSLVFHTPATRYEPVTNSKAEALI